MSEHTAISWCDSTFNPWIGCTKVSPACDHCYAERLMDHRMHKVEWGAGQQRMRTSSANWRKPLQWNAKRFMQCEDCGWRGEAECAVVGCGVCGSIELSDTRRRVFCASLADVFDNEVPLLWRVELLTLIGATEHIDWLLLTKRIGNVTRLLCEAAELAHERSLTATSHWITAWIDGEPPQNVLLGATICNQEEADRDIPKLLATPAARRFLSIEPMLGPIDLVLRGERFHRRGDVDSLRGEKTTYIGAAEDGRAMWAGSPCERIDWVICGGESGPHARPMRPDWVRSLRDQCAEASVPFHFKQWGEWTPGCGPDGEGPTRHRWRGGAYSTKVGTKAAGRLLDDVEHNGFPSLHAMKGTSPSATARGKP